MNKGKYIVLEGPEGVGKTTQLQELAWRLQAAGLPVRQLREPDSQSDLTARAIRQLTQDPRYPMNTRSEVLLYNAARAQSLQVIKQSVDNGVICLVDRNYLTTLAIQYYGRGDVPDYQAINAIIDFAVGGMEPDLCIILDAPVNTLRERLKDRYSGDRFDNLDDAFLERVRAGYLWEARQRDLPVVFATQEASDVANDIWKLVSETLANRRSRPAATTAPASVKEIIEQKKLPATPPAKTEASESAAAALNDEESVQQSDAIQVVVEEISYLLAPVLGDGKLSSIIAQPVLDPKQDGDNGYLYYTPNYLKPEIKQQYKQAMDLIFSTYDTMLHRLVAHNQGNSVVPGRERGKAWQTAAHEQARDTLRAILPLATASGLLLATPREGMDDLITELLSQELPEARQLGQSLQQRGHEGTPLMLEDGSVVDSNEAVSAYQRQTRFQLSELAHEHLPDNYATTSEAANLVDFWPKNELLLVPDMLYEYSNSSLDHLQAEVNAWPYNQKTTVFTAYVGRRRSPRQRPGRAMEKAHYSWDLISDYGSFVDMQQHLVADDLSHQLLTPRYGFELPKVIEAAGLTEQFEYCFEVSLKLHSYLQQAGYPLEAQYATLMGHKLRWKVTYNAREAFRLLEASYDQSATLSLANKMHEKLAEIHPLIADSISFATV